MKFLFAFGIFVIALTAVYGTADHWNEYKSKHGKKYNSKDDGKRKEIFLATHAKINKHNSQKNVTYTLEHNKFSDMTDDELAKFTGSVEPDNESRSLESTITIDMTNRALPISLDYRAHFCLPKIKDQGSCGSCWAFAAIAPLEFAECLKYGSPVVLSEQQLVDCDTYNNGCSGGWTPNAWYYLKNVAGGSAKNSSYPYTATKSTCKSANSIIGAKISSYNALTAPNATSIQSALLTYGPIKISFAVVNSFYFYSSGVYTDITCDGVANNHAMVVVGYGTLNGIDYWIVRNSWGLYWGISGYSLIQRGVNKCKIETYPAFITSVV